MTYPKPDNGFAGRLTVPPVIYEGVHLSEQELSQLVAWEQANWAISKAQFARFWEWVERK